MVRGDELGDVQDVRVVHASCQGEPLRSSPVDPLPPIGDFKATCLRSISEAITGQ